MGNQYGPYVMYFLSRLMQKQREAADINEADATGSAKLQERAGKESETEERLFARDETHSHWHKETKIELLERKLHRNTGAFFEGRAAGRRQNRVHTLAADTGRRGVL